MYYFITYSTMINGILFIENTVIDQSPIDWILETRKKYPEENFRLIEWMVISQEQWEKLDGQF